MLITQGLKGKDKLHEKDARGFLLLNFQLSHNLWTTRK